MDSFLRRDALHFLKGELPATPADEGTRLAMPENFVRDEQYAHRGDHPQRT